MNTCTITTEIVEQKESKKQSAESQEAMDRVK